MTPDPRILDADDLVANTLSLRALARALVVDEHQAEDLAQEAFVTALGKAGAGARSRSSDRTSPQGVDSAAGLRAWLAGITRNHARQLRRTHRRRLHREEAVARDESQVEEDVIEHLDLLEHLLVQVRALAEPYRTAILLRYIEGLDSQEAAVRLGIPAVTLRSHVKRGLTKLRSRMDETTEDGRQGWLAPLGSLAGGAASSVGAMTKGAVLAAALAACAGGWWWLGVPSGAAKTPGAKLAATQATTRAVGPTEGSGVSDKSLFPAKKLVKAPPALGAKLRREKELLSRIAKKLKSAVKSGQLTESEAIEKWRAILKQHGMEKPVDGKLRPTMEDAARS